MDNKDLKARIDRVHQQLEDSKINREERDLIGHLMTEIVNVGGEKDEDTDIPSLKEMLDQQATKFENSHPAIAGAIRQVMNALSNMGI